MVPLNCVEAFEIGMAHPPRYRYKWHDTKGHTLGHQQHQLGQAHQHWRSVSDANTQAVASSSAALPPSSCVCLCRIGHATLCRGPGKGPDFAAPNQCGIQRQAVHWQEV